MIAPVCSKLRVVKFLVLLHKFPGNSMQKILPDTPIRELITWRICLIV